MPAWGVTQAILHDPQRPEVPGDCMRAATASLLELPLDAVPHFVTFLWWQPAAELWARGRGLTMRYADVATPADIPLFRHILCGRSPREISHCVVAEEGRVVWDPHPSRAGLATVTDAWWFEPWPHEDDHCWTCGTPTSATSPDDGGEA